jgi:Membrane bound beta barrel domain (DUF5777)
MKSLFFFSLCVCALSTYAQQPDMLSQVNDQPKKELVTGTFKSSRVINSQSVEFIGKGVLDVRILHRFDPVNRGISDLFGLDHASMRFGFDYGITKNLTIGIGRSTFQKEYDGFLKYRVIQQSTGPGAFPVSIVAVAGITAISLPYPDNTVKNYFSSRLGYYYELLAGRKITSAFSLQAGGLVVHRNLVDSVRDSNDTWVLSLGGRLKFSKRMAFVVDYHPIISGKQKGTVDPLSMGIDIETGGHVFQLHFSNSTGMNERAFITQTTNKWGKGEVRFGFNLSRVFNVRKKKA